MTLGLHAFRSRQRTLARWVLALFSLVWLQAAIVPCAMAVVPEGLAGMGEEHCSWCPPDADGHPGSPDLATGDRCTYPDDPQADTRADVRAGAPALLLLGPPLLVVAAEPAGAGATFGHDLTRPPDRGGTSLAIAYCRHLK